MRKQKDTINLIGAGLSNLICATHLSNQGVKVNIFEAHSECGGVIGVIKRKDYIFEKTTHQMPGFQLKHYISDIIKKIDIKDLEYVKMPYIYKNFLINNNEIIDQYLFPSGTENLKNTLIESFPQYKKQINEFIQTIVNITKDTIRIMRVEDLSSSFFTIIPVLYDALTALCLKNKNEKSLIFKIGKFSYKYLVKYYNSTYSELLKDFDKKIQTILSQYCFICDIPPEKIPVILMAVVFYIFCLDGPYLVKNGSKVLIDKLTDIIKSNGGEIYLNKKISKIILDNKGKAIGLATDKGEEYYCDKIISGISPQKLFFEMIENKYVDKEYLNHLKNLELTHSGFITFIGIPIKFEDYGIKSSCILFDHVEKDFSSNPELQKNNLLLTNFSKLDNYYAPEGKSAISIFKFEDYSRWENLSENQYKKQKKETEDNIIKIVEKCTNIPVKNKADIIFSATPLTFKRYMENYRGEVYASRRTVEQNFDKRTPTKTTIENLYLAGAYNSPGAGFTAVIENGYMTAKKILKGL